MVTTKVMQLMNKGEMFWIERENCYCGVEVLVVENRVELGAIDIIVSCLKKNCDKIWSFNFFNMNIFTMDYTYVISWWVFDDKKNLHVFSFLL